MSNEILKAIEKGFKKDEIKTIFIHYENRIIKVENFYYWSYKCTPHIEIDYENGDCLSSFKAESYRINNILVHKEFVDIFIN